jgi:hypothetical protein
LSVDSWLPSGLVSGMTLRSWPPYICSPEAVRMSAASGRSRATRTTWGNRSIRSKSTSSFWNTKPLAIVTS